MIRSRVAAALAGCAEVLLAVLFLQRRQFSLQRQDKSGSCSTAEIFLILLGCGKSDWSDWVRDREREKNSSVNSIGGLSFETTEESLRNYYEQ